MEMQKVEEVKININPNVLNERKNNGAMTKPCNNCGGYGFTLALKGGRIPCLQCEQSGNSEMSNRELQTLILGLYKDMSLLKKALLETLSNQGLTLKSNPEETIHV